MKKIIISTFTFILLILSACKESSKPDEMYYGLNQYGNIGEDSDYLYLMTDNKIYQFDKKTKKSDIICHQTDCEHETEECAAFIQNGASLFIHQDNLYAASLDSPQLRVLIYSEDKQTKSLLYENKDYSGESLGLFYSGGFLYYVSDESPLGLTIRECRLLIKRIELKTDAEPEIICEILRSCVKLRADTIHLYDNKLILNVVTYMDHNEGYSLIYDLTSKSYIDREFPYNLAYSSGHLYYSDESQKTLVSYDIKSNQESKLFDTQAPYTFCGSDEQYIYMSYDPNNNIQSAEAIPQVLIYTLQGEYVKTISLDNFSTPNSATYMCSNDSLVCFGSNGYPESPIVIVDKANLHNDSDNIEQFLITK